MTQSFGVLPLSILQGKAPFSKSLQAFHSTNSKHKAETARALRIILQIANPIVILIYSFIAMAFVNPIINLIFLAVVMLSMLYTISDNARRKRSYWCSNFPVRS